jgi:hypothetical protein
MPRLRLADEQVARAGYAVGGLLVVVAIALALRILDETSVLPDVSSGWSAVSDGRAYITTATLIIALSGILGPRHEKFRRLRPIAVVSLGLLAVLTVRAAVREDLWNSTGVLVTGAPFALFLLLPFHQPSLPLGGPAKWGIYIGCFIAVVAVVGSINEAREPNPLFSSGWVFLESITFPLGMGMLLVIISLPQEMSLRSRQRMALILANCVLLAGLAVSVHFVDVFRFEEEWLFVSYFSNWVALALLIVAAVGLLRTEAAIVGGIAVVVAAVATSIRFATIGDGFDEWNFVNGIYVRLAYASLILLCAVIADRGRGEEAVGQSWEAVPAAP